MNAHPHFRKKHFSILLWLSLAILASCKEDSAKHAASADPDPLAAGEAAVASITLDGKASGTTLTVSNPDLTQNGGFTIQIIGIADANLVLGATVTPAGVVIDNTSGVHKLTGIMPSTSAQAYDIVIFARDKTKCTGSNCTVAPNGNGIFSGGQVIFSAASDVLGNFKLQLDAGAVTDEPSWYEKFKTKLGDTAVSFLEFLKEFFAKITG